jgi:hypothetical protein
VVAFSVPLSSSRRRQVDRSVRRLNQGRSGVSTQPASLMDAAIGRIIEASKNGQLSETVVLF